MRLILFIQLLVFFHFIRWSNFQVKLQYNVIFKTSLNLIIFLSFRKSSQRKVFCKFRKSPEKHLQAFPKD